MQPRRGHAAGRPRRCREKILSAFFQHFASFARDSASVLLNSNRENVINGDGISWMLGPGTAWLGHWRGPGPPLFFARARRAPAVPRTGAGQAAWLLRRLDMRAALGNHGLLPRRATPCRRLLIDRSETAGQPSVSRRGTWPWFFYGRPIPSNAGWVAQRDAMGPRRAILQVERLETRDLPAELLGAAAPVMIGPRFARFDTAHVALVEPARQPVAATFARCRQ